MAKLPALLIITTALIFSLACAAKKFEEGDPRGFVLDDARSVSFFNYKAFLDDDHIPYELLGGAIRGDAYRASIEEWSWELGEDVGRIDLLIGVERPGGSYTIVVGQFDSEALQSNKEEFGYLSRNEDWFQKGRDAWITENGYVFVDFPEYGFHVVGDQTSLLALREGSGLADDSSVIGKLLNRIDLNSFEVEIESNCSNRNLEGCLGTAMSITDGDAKSLEVSFVLLFESEKNAESAGPEIQRRFERAIAEAAGSGESGELTDLVIDGGIVTYRLAIEQARD